MPPKQKLSCPNWNCRDALPISSLPIAFQAFDIHASEIELFSPQGPRDLTLKGPKHEKGSASYEKYTAHMLQSPVAALRLLPSIALSSEPAWA